MIKAKDIKAILLQIPSGTTLDLSQIKKFLQNNLYLTKEDWEPHTKTRLTNYPKWLHKTQGVLSEYKRNGKIKHNSQMHTYTF